MKTHFIALASLLALSSGLLAAEDEASLISPEQIEALSEEVVTGETEVVVPEPSSTFFAGLGGVALLFFFLRRKPS